MHNIIEAGVSFWGQYKREDFAIETNIKSKHRRIETLTEWRASEVGDINFKKSPLGTYIHVTNNISSCEF